MGATTQGMARDKAAGDRRGLHEDQTSKNRPDLRVISAGVADALLEHRPTASTDLAEFYTLVAFGSATAIEKRYGVKPRMQDRL